MAEKAIHFGAGKIGRGFIGYVLSRAGYELCFADVNRDLVSLLDRERRYTVHVVDFESHDEEVEGFRAVLGGSPEMLELFKEASLVTTAVSMKVLPLIAPTIEAGLEARRGAGVEAPLNIISCENGVRATSTLRGYVLEHFSDVAWLDAHVGFADSSVDRIVPMLSFDHPLDVAVEEFFEWCVDATQLKAPLRTIPGLNLTTDLLSHIERKLYTVNTGHCTTAWLGNRRGCTYISEVLDIPEIRSQVLAVMEQSGEALIAKFGLDRSEQAAYIRTVLRRFRNPHLKDLVARVGGDPVRKLGPSLYLSYPIRMALQYGTPTDQLCLALGAALHTDIPGDAQSVQLKEMIASMGIEAAIVKITGLQEPPIVKAIADGYAAYAAQ